MTDETIDIPAAPEAATAKDTINKGATSLSGKSTAFWAGVGIGSAAIIAAVMYARRPKKRK